jgi:hypothetical protein
MPFQGGGVHPIAYEATAVAPAGNAPDQAVPVR